jgi:outer membrane scaffolding protein for murein synthesis (MipA/OmpV family)
MASLLRVLTAAALALPLAARGQAMEPLWEFGMGATGLSIPDYRGSDESRYYVLPIPYFVYRGDKLRVDRQGPRAKVFESPRLELDFSALITPPVDSAKNRARQGMPDLDPTVEIGPQVNFIVARDLQKDWRFDLRLPVRAVVATDIKHSRGAGYTVFPHAYFSGHPELFGARWNLGLTAGPLFGSRDYHAYFYSVAPQFATPERPAYEAPGGYSGAVASGSLGRRFGKLWAGGFVRYDTLRGAAFETSPLVRQNYSVVAGVAFAWVFAESAERVAGREF